MGLQIRRAPSLKYKLLVTFVAVFALAAQPMYGFVASRAANALSTTTEVVTSGNMNGWSKYGSAPSKFVTTNSPLGAGALELSANTASEYSMHWKSATGSSLQASNLNVHYSTKRLAGPAHAAASYVVVVDPDGSSATSDGFYAIYEPAYNDNGSENYDEWNTWTITPESKFWYTAAYGPRPAGAINYTPLNNVLDTMPNATVIATVINFGSGNSGWKALVDNVKTADNVIYDFEPDTAAPTFAINSPVNGQYVAGTTTLKAEIKDESDIAKVLMTIPGLSTRSWTNGASSTITRTGDIFSTTINTKTLADGPTHVTLRGTDGAGNTRYWNNNAAARQHVFYIDNTAPEVVTQTAPANNATVGNKLSLRFTVSDSGSGVKQVNIHVFQNNDTKKIIPLQHMGGNTWGVDNADITDLASGEYSFVSRAQDNVGNTRVGTGTNHGTIVVDHDAPAAPTALSWKTSTGVTVANNGFTNIASGVASWQGSSENGVTYLYTYWNDIPGNQYKEDNRYRPAPISNLSQGGVFNQGEGTHYIQVFAQDAYGNVSPGSNIIAINYDKTSPEAQIIAPATNGKVVRGTVAITGKMADKNPHSHWFEIKGPNGYNYSTGAAHANGLDSWTIDWNTSGLATGEYTIRYVAKDKAGNRNDDPNFTNSTTRTVIVDNEAPQANLSSTRSGLTNAGEVKVTRSASDNRTIASSKYCVNGSCSATSGAANGTESYTAEGDYTITFEAWDEAGASTGEKTVKFTIDRTPPSPPAMTYATHSGVGGTAEPGSKVSIYIGNVHVGSATADANGKWSFSFNGLLVTVAHTIRVVATDAAGNESKSTNGVINAVVVTSDGGLAIDNVTNGSLASISGLSSVLAGNGGSSATAQNSTANAEIDPNGSGEILGAETTDTPLEKTAVIAPSEQGWKLWGVAWYWYLLMAVALMASWWLIAGLIRRRRAQEQ